MTQESRTEDRASPISDSDANFGALVLLVWGALAVLVALFLRPWTYDPGDAVRYGLANLVPIVLFFVWLTYRAQKRDAALSARLIGAQDDLSARDDSAVAPAWLIARATLEKYWQRNLSQNYLVFGLSVLSMVAGFGVMLFGITRGFSPEHTSVAWAAAAGGAITQFIGATFLLIYRTTLDQASAYNNTLERINAVGMSWYILETMPESTPDEKAAKNGAKVEIISRIVGPSSIDRAVGATQ